MSIKTRNFILLTFAVVTGLLFGYFYPERALAVLSVMGPLVGISIFFFLRTPESKKEKPEDFKNNAVYILIRMLLCFIIGAAVGSSIPATLAAFGL